MVSQENTGKAISVKCHFLKVKSKYGTEKKNASLFSDNIQSDQGEQARPTDIRAHRHPCPGSLSL